MSMILQLMRISDRDLMRLQTKPEAVVSFIAQGEPLVPGIMDDAAMRAMAAAKGIPLAPPPPRETFDSYPFTAVLDVDKDWHGLYFLLTGAAYDGPPPAGWLLNSPPIGNVDVGYGPAMAISVEHTAALSAWLDGLSRQDVVARFDAAKMEALNIYPSIWDEDPDDLKDELGTAFDALKAYCAKCANHGLGMISYIT